MLVLGITSFLIILAIGSTTYFMFKNDLEIRAKQEMEQAYVKSKGYETWSEYLMHLGYYGHFNDQCRNFWKNVSLDFAEPPTVRQRMIRYFVTTSFGAWFIQRYLGMKGRMAA